MLPEDVVSLILSSHDTKPIVYIDEAEQLRFMSQLMREITQQTSEKERLRLMLQLFSELLDKEYHIVNEGLRRQIQRIANQSQNIGIYNRTALIDQEYADNMRILGAQIKRKYNL